MKRLSGFSLMEMMVVLLIVAVVAAASAPMVNKRMLNAAAERSPWVWTGLNNSIAYNLNANNAQTAIIGAAQVPDIEGFRTRLFINSPAMPALSFSGGEDSPVINLQSNQDSIFLSDSSSNVQGTVAIGVGVSTDENTVVIGNEASSGDIESVAIGRNASGNMGGVTIGNNSNISRGFDSVAIGQTARVMGDNAVAIGGSRENVHWSANANGDYAVAIGSLSDAEATGVAIGTHSKSTIPGSIVIGAMARDNIGNNAAADIGDISSILLAAAPGTTTLEKPFVDPGTDPKDDENSDNMDPAVKRCGECLQPIPIHASWCRWAITVRCGHYSDCDNRFTPVAVNGDKEINYEGMIYHICPDCVQSEAPYRGFSCWRDEHFVTGHTHSTQDRDGDGECDNCDSHPDDPHNGGEPPAEDHIASIEETISNTTGGGPAIAIGSGAETNAAGLAIGHFASANGVGAIAIGNNSNEAGGDGAIATGQFATAVGHLAVAEDESAVAIGNNTQATAARSIAIGNWVNRDGNAGGSSIAIGNGPVASGENSIAIGHNASATGQNSVAIGNGVGSAADNVIVLGSPTSTVHIPGNLVIGSPGHRGYVAATGDIVSGQTIAGRSLIGQRIYEDSNANGSASYLVFGMAGLTIGFDSGSYSGDNTTDVDYDTYEAWRAMNLQETVVQDSDRRLKDVGEIFTGGLEEIKKLEVFNFTYKKDPSKTPRVGVMAQDLQKIFPKAVFEGKDGFLRIRMEEMFYALVNAVKQLDAKIEELKNNQIAQLLDKVANLEKQNKEQAEVNAKQAKINAEQAELIEKLAKQNEAIAKQNKELEKRIKKLEK